MTDQLEKSRILAPVDFGVELKARNRKALMLDGLDDAVLLRDRRHAEAGGHDISESPDSTVAKCSVLSPVRS